MTASAIYADNIGKVSVINGSVRIELLTIDEIKENKAISYKRQGEIVIPLDGFVKGFETQKRLVDALVKDGVIVQNSNSDVTNSN